MIADSPKLVVGDIAIVYIRKSDFDFDKDAPTVRSVEVKTVGLTSAVWTFNYGTQDSFTYSEVEYVLRNGRWQRA